MSKFLSRSYARNRQEQDPLLYKNQINYLQNNNTPEFSIIPKIVKIITNSSVSYTAGRKHPRTIHDDMYTNASLGKSGMLV